MTFSRKPFLYLILPLILFSIGIGCAARSSHSGGGGGSQPPQNAFGSDWSPEDLKRVSNYMADSIANARFTRSSRYRREKPRWMLAREMKNDTDQHINTRVIMEKIRTQLFKRSSGLRPFRFIDDQAVEEALQQLGMQQSALFDNNSAAKIGKLKGAKLILRGRISNLRRRTSQVDRVFYNITLQAVDLETLDIVWTDETEISRVTVKDQYR